MIYIYMYNIEFCIHFCLNCSGLIMLDMDFVCDFEIVQMLY